MKKTTFLLFLAIIIFTSINSYSNDSGISAVGGTWVVMKDEHPSIQMERETIDINVYKDYYDVVAVFIFKNHGDACSVFMGFPETGGGDLNCNADLSCFLMFETSVDGIPTEAKRQLIKNDGDEYLAYWIKEVSFGKDDTKKVIVHYQSPLGSGVSAYYQGSDNFTQYLFSGGNWFGKVEESKLNVNFNIPVIVREKDREGNILKPGLKKEADSYTYYRTNWEAEEYFSLWFRIKE